MKDSVWFKRRKSIFLQSFFLMVYIVAGTAHFFGVYSLYAADEQDPCKPIVLVVIDAISEGNNGFCRHGTHKHDEYLAKEAIAGVLTYYIAPSFKGCLAHVRDLFII